MRLVKQLLTVALVAFAGGQATQAVSGNTALALIFGVVTAVLTLFAYRWIVRRTEHRAPDEVALDRRGLGRGVLIGLGMFAAVIGAIAVFGGYRVGGWGSVSGAIAILGVMVGAAVTEEVVFRGILFRITEGRFGTWAALGLTSLLFGMAHLLNPHASLWGALAIAIEAGGMLGAAYVATRNLWLPIGLHFGWNYAEGALFGTDVSGTDGPQGLVHGVLSGPAALSGGAAFGPEGSVFAVLAGVLATVIFLRLARRRGHIVPRRRREVEATATATLIR